MSFKKLMLVTHRWLGLASGLVVFVISVTGCLFVFQKEITQWMRKDVMYIESRKPERLSVKEIGERAKDGLDVDHLSFGVVSYRNPQQAWTAFNYEGKAAYSYFGSIKDYRTIYVDPYSGAELAVINEEKDFFQIMKGIHWSLLLATPIGQPVVVWSTVIFIVLLITGMVLWWPRKWNQAGRNKSFKVKWKASWKRVNYDLHNVLGFYALMLALIVAITGLYWAFPVMKKTLHFMGTGEFKLPEPKKEKVISRPVFSGNDQEDVLEEVYAKAWNEFPDAYSIAFITPPDSAGTINTIIRMDGKTYYEKNEMRFDQYTGEVLYQDTYEEKNAGEKLLAMNYDIHVGAIGGITGKVLAFLGSLVCASLPLTGFLIWWNRRKRRKKK